MISSDRPGWLATAITLLQDLPFGVYCPSVQVEGFAAWSDVVEVHSIVPLKVDVVLGVAPVTTKVQVNDEKTLVDPTATGSLFSIGHQSIQENLDPQPGRDLLDLTASQPGWLFEASGVLDPRGSEYDVQFVVDGQPLTQNRSPAFAPDMDSDEVESMRVLTANFPAEYGRKLGGVVEITTDESVPMGWHGELDAAGGQLRSSEWDRRHFFFDRERPFLRSRLRTAFRSLPRSAGLPELHQPGKLGRNPGAVRTRV